MADPNEYNTQGFERALSVTQKAQVIIDILAGINNLDGVIDDVVAKRKYKVHQKKKDNFKYQMRMLKAGGKDVKQSLTVCLKTLTILQDAEFRKKRADERKADNMKEMLKKLK